MPAPLRPKPPTRAPLPGGRQGVPAARLVARILASGLFAAALAVLALPAPLEAAQQRKAQPKAAPKPAAKGQPKAATRSAATAAELAALKARIEQVSREVGRDAVERDRLLQELRAAELAVAGARQGLESVATEASRHAARRAELANERAAAAAKLEREREALASQLRMAYRNGPHETLQLLLAGGNPAQGGRLLVWYGYFARARALQLQRIEQSVQRLADLDAQLATQQQALEQLRQSREKQLGALEQGRTRRQGALVQLQDAAQTRAAQLERLRSQQASLERLLRELARAARPSAPSGTPDNGTAFGRLRGQLAWPVSGHIVARYGEQRATGVNWEGVVVDAERGTAVRAIAAGRVLYADWLPGLGLLTIIDHGEGYLSLYGYNEQLRHAAGDAVAAGDVLATVGDSGGRAEPQLYFELRRGGRPLDPSPWFRGRAPD
jgi:murein hydrolase activator